MLNIYTYQDRLINKLISMCVSGTYINYKVNMRQLCIMRKKNKAGIGKQMFSVAKQGLVLLKNEGFRVMLVNTNL